MHPAARKSLAFYQIFYGFLGFAYAILHLALSFNSSTLKTSMVFLAISLLSLLVIAAGIYALKASDGWLMLSMLAQVLQVNALATNNLYLVFRCGISYDYFPEKGGFKLNLLDLNSGITWSGESNYRTGLNLFALAIFAFLLLHFFILRTTAAKNKVG